MSAVMPEHPVNLELRNGAVVVTISDNYAIFTPDQAVEFAQQMAKYAYEAKTGLAPKDKSAIAERIKEKMVTRCSLVLRSLQEKKKTNLYIANALVDIILSEAL